MDCKRIEQACWASVGEQLAAVNPEMFATLLERLTALAAAEAEVAALRLPRAAAPFFCGHLHELQSSS